MRPHPRELRPHVRQVGGPQGAVVRPDRRARRGHARRHSAHRLVGVPGLALASTPAAPVDKRSGGATQRGAAHSEPPPSPLEVTSPMKTVGDELPHQSVKKGRAEKGPVETVTKEQTPADKRRAAKVRHEKVAAVLSLLVQYHATAPEASVETALDANDDSPTDAAMWLLNPKHTEKFSVRPVERA